MVIKKLSVNREEFKQALNSLGYSYAMIKVRGVFLELKPNLLRLLANNPGARTC